MFIIDPFTGMKIGPDWGPGEKLKVVDLLVIQTQIYSLTAVDVDHEYKGTIKPVGIILKLPPGMLGCFSSN